MLRYVRKWIGQKLESLLYHVHKAKRDRMFSPNHTWTTALLYSLQCCCKGITRWQQWCSAWRVTQGVLGLSPGLFAMIWEIGFFCVLKCYYAFLYARLQTGRIMVWWCPSVRPGLHPSVTVFRTFLLHALTYWSELLCITLFLFM